jgi:opacity protein-like surface antigen
MIHKITILVLTAMFLPLEALANFYIKGGVGLNHINTAKFSNHAFEGEIKLANSFPLLELGIGYKVNESIRTELLFDYYFLFRTNELSTSTNNNVYRISSKTKANAITLNAYKDITNIGIFTPFVGGGVGIATLNESANGYAVFQEYNEHCDLDGINGKKLNRFTYKLTAGTDIRLSNNITGEISYNYFNLGNNKTKTVGGIANIGNRTYEIQNITLGMRFAL